MRGHHIGFICRGFLPPNGPAGEIPEFDIKLSLWASLLCFPRGYLLRAFLQRDISVRWWGFGIRVFPLIGELTKAMEPHLLGCQLYR